MLSLTTATIGKLVPIMAPRPGKSMNLISTNAMIMFASQLQMLLSLQIKYQIFPRVVVGFFFCFFAIHLEMNPVRI